ncbi:hypothetical protein KFZ70_04110 [Tamlana fucoidanivorans]|uniref:Uncharacterized protein n=1 Tax=Allotamlana fucoidanivorans TaxID=2583814 RepID=A0A5C4SCS2_9FLAO|nr:hypothetical protein [Tamlana fucoidanivorans]TNJ40998.1 hypothetical protein FGF67_16600 [Tamlana fucoidanivorans]
MKLIAIILIIIGTTVKALFGHLALNWANLESTSLILYLIGFTILIYNLVSRIDKNRKELSFKKNPLKWIFSRSIFIYILIIPIVIALIYLGENLNIKMQEYFLGQDTEKTVATFVGFEQQSYLIKYGRETKEFAMFEYKTPNGLIKQGLPKEEFKLKKSSYTVENNKLVIPNNIKNQKVEIVYSKRFPSIFKII